MAETRNTFIKSRMNKDLDARILPKGEYRDANNVAISRSNEDTVGALENVLGNIEISNFGLDRFIRNKSIVTLSLNSQTPFTPLTTEDILLTGGAGAQGEVKITTDAAGIITLTQIENGGLNYNVGDVVTATSAVLGAAIYTVTSIYEICLDNLEVIGAKEDEATNRMYAFITNHFDDSYDHLSNRALTPNLEISEIGSLCFVVMYDFNSNTPYVLVHGSWLNLSTTHPVYGINIIEDFLFWTDNRNQPRKININKAINSSSYYDSEHNISVAKIAPVDTPTVELYDRTSPLLPDDTTVNPDYDANWDGDPDFLLDKFARFSYRYKFEDNEYSLMAPFTQVCFIPQQDGFFIKKNDGTNVTQEDELKTYQSTEVPFMRNKVDEVVLTIRPHDFMSPGGFQFADTSTKLKSVEILYKESDGLSFKIVEEIFVKDITSSNLTYTFKGKKPIKTLPDFEVTRVGSSAPIRALAQEVVGNRIVYGNFVNKNTSPTGLNYRVKVVDKVEADEQNFQNLSLKQNRSYEVGLILQDAYGRQSSVVLSNLQNNEFDSSIIFNPYRDASQGLTNFINNTDYWYGNKLQLDFESPIPNLIPEYIGYPGIYDRVTNPLGWYSYKVVIQQTEQDYYNVYYPGMLSGYINPNTAATPEDPIGHFVLHGDNINKIPRDLQEVGPGQNLFKSINVNTRQKHYRPEYAWVSEAEYETLVEGGYNSGLYGIVGDERKILKDTEITDKDDLDEIYTREWSRIARQIRLRQGNIPDNSSAKLFHRVINTSSQGSQQYFFSSTSAGNSKYEPDIVGTIGTGQQLSLYQLPPSGTMISQGNAFYNFADDPLIARVDLNSKVVTTSNIVGFNAPGGIPKVGMTVTSTSFPYVAGTDMLPVLSVSETVPTKSNLDLYYETSTSGTISQFNRLFSITNAENQLVINKLIDFADFVRQGTLSNMRLFTYGSPKVNVNEGSVFTNVTPISGEFVTYAVTTGALDPITNTTLTLLKVRDGVDNDLTSYFSLIKTVSAIPDRWQLNARNGWSPVSYGDERDIITVFVDCANSAGTSTIIPFAFNIQNKPPQIAGPGVININWSVTNNGFNTPMATIVGDNGSANEDLLGQTCFWKLQNTFGLFELRNQKISDSSTNFNKNEIQLYLKNTATIEDAAAYTVVVELDDRQYPSGNASTQTYTITLTA